MTEDRVRRHVADGRPCGERVRRLGGDGAVGGIPVPAPAESQDPARAPQPLDLAGAQTVGEELAAPQHTGSGPGE